MTDDDRQIHLRSNTHGCELIKEPSKKRKHKFVGNVANNEPVAKKAGRSMVSKSIVRTRKKHVK